MDENQALKAWDLVKGTDDPLKELVWGKVKHAFDRKAYIDYYSNTLREFPVDDQKAFDCTSSEPRLLWVATMIVDRKQSPMIDLGCADGYLGLTVARHGIECTGINLYKQSVDIANRRAWENNLPCKFLCGDLFDHEGSYKAVVLMEVLEHLPDPDEGIEKAVSLCEKGGSVYLSTPRNDHYGIEVHMRQKDREGWDDGKPAGHLRLFTEEEFRKMISQYQVEQFLVDPNRNMLVEIKV